MRSVLGQKYYVPFHAFCLFTNFIGCAYELAYIKLPIFESYGGRFKFLTHWNQYFHLCYFAYAVVVEIYMLLFNDEESSGSQNQFLKLKGASINSHILRQLGDFIFVSICFPFGVMVCVLFWIITLMEPDGLASKETRKVVPLSSVYNQYLHTFPFILNCLGIWLIQFMYPKRSLGWQPSLFWLSHIWHGWSTSEITQGFGATLSSNIKRCQNLLDL